MARHYRGNGDSGETLKLAALLVIAASLLFVLCRLYPQTMPRPLVNASDKVAAAARSISAQIKTTLSPVEPQPEKAEKPEQTQTKDAAAKRQPQKNDAVSDDSIAADQPTDDEDAGSGKPPLAVVIDDAGDQLRLTRRVAALDLPATWAIMPNCKYTKKTASIADVKGTPYILHLPMQALSDQDGGPYSVGEDLTSADIARNTSDCLAQLPNAVGLSNHRGSLATSKREVIEPVIEILKQRGLLFFDSRTSGKSVAFGLARELGVSAAQNSRFLDGEADLASIEAQFDEAVKIAVRNGGAAVICHFRPVTVQFLEKLNKSYRKLPVRLVTLPEFIKARAAGEVGADKSE